MFCFGQLLADVISIIVPSNFNKYSNFEFIAFLKPLVSYNSGLINRAHNFKSAYHLPARTRWEEKWLGEKVRGGWRNVTKKGK